MPAHSPSPDGIYYNPDGTPWTPEFESQRPPFQKGNELNLKHGAFSPARVDPLSNSFRDEILESPKMQYLAEPQFATLFWQWCRAAARVSLIEAWVDGMDIEDAAKSDKGQTSALELLRKWVTTLQGLSSRCGLDPLSYQKLRKDVVSEALDLATLLSKRPDTGTQDGAAQG